MLPCGIETLLDKSREREGGRGRERENLLLYF
jgi:hypothetical protein